MFYLECNDLNDFVFSYNEIGDLARVGAYSEVGEPSGKGVTQIRIGIVATAIAQAGAGIIFYNEIVYVTDNFDQHDSSDLSNAITNGVQRIMGALREKGIACIQGRWLSEAPEALR